jgi:predicted amidohydrolase
MPRTEPIRAELIRRLETPEPLSPAACMVLLWTYFADGEVGLGAVENRVSALWGHPLRLPHLPLISGFSAKWLSDARDALRKTKDPAELDILALRWLKGLDLLLSQGEFQDFAGAPLVGVDEKPYTVQSRNGFLASHYEETALEVRWAAHQGLSLAAYCRHFVVVPGYSVGGFQIQSRSAIPRSHSFWGTAHLHDRLRAEREKLRILLWPFQTALDYPGIEAFTASPPPDEILLDTVRNESELQAEIRQALAAARSAKVTLLIFPELSVPLRTEEMIRQELSRSGVDGHPILTLFGCCHRQPSDGGRPVNEAVLLGPSGAELHRHRKLVRFTDYRFGEHHPVPEKVETGTVVTVLESAFGNLVPLICIDFINEAVEEVLFRCHGNLYPVPSLSPETNAHQVKAVRLQVHNLAATFVCNRWIGPLSKGSPSFFRLPRQKGLTLHEPGSAEASHLLFDLGEP